MSTTPEPAPDCSAERIHALHAWYEANVMKMRCTPEVERLWFQFCKAGYNGQQLKRVILYLRREINRGKRNNGSLSISSMLRPDEAGVLRFSIDLGLSGANYGIESKLSALPASEGEPAQPQRHGQSTAGAQPLPGVHLTAAQLADRRSQLDALRAELSGQIRNAAPLPELDH
jgi:hypothetical protein